MDLFPVNRPLTRRIGLIPVTLGNIIGGSLFVATYYYWMFIYGQAPISVDGVLYEDDHRAPQSDSGSESLRKREEGSVQQIV